MATDFRSDVELFYNEQREIAASWGVMLPSWSELTWEEHISWADSMNQIESEHHDS